MRKSIFKKLLIVVFAIGAMATGVTVFALIEDVNILSILAGIFLLVAWVFAFLSLVCYNKMKYSNTEEKP